MQYQAIHAAVAAGQQLAWVENECGNDRLVRFEVYVSKWTNVIGAAGVRCFLPRVKPAPEGGYYCPKEYMGVGVYPIEEGEVGYRRARVAAMVDAYRTRTACESNE